MNKLYWKIFANVLVLVVMFAALAAVPKEWQVKSGMSRAEYNKAWQKANLNLEKARTESEKRAAATVVRGLYNYQMEGNIDKVEDMNWLLNAIRFVLIIIILSFSVAKTKQIMKEVRSINSPDEAAKSSATGR